MDHSGEKIFIHATRMDVEGITLGTIFPVKFTFLNKKIV